MDAARPLPRSTQADRRLSAVAPAPPGPRAGSLSTTLGLSPGEYGYDRLGCHPATLEAALPALRFLHERWFRTTWEQAEPLPEGRVIVVANRVGSDPWDALVLIAGALADPTRPRLLRAPAAAWWLRLPWLGDLTLRLGAYPAHPATAIDLLRDQQALLALPENRKGLDAGRRGRVARLTPSFVKLAEASHAPIVPVAIRGGDERAPALLDLNTLGRRLGLNDLALTPLFPWLGPRGLLPLPVRHHVIVGQPIRFDDGESDDETTLGARADIVRRALQNLLERALARP